MVQHQSANASQIQSEIVNVVATAKYPFTLDIVRLGEKKGFLHDAEKYGGRCAYLRSPKIIGEVTIFPSGKMISTGARSLNDSYSNLEQAFRRISEESGEETIYTPSITIQNIVICMTLNQKLDLERLAIEKSETIYEPEIFPGMIYRNERLQGAAMLVFASGKIVVAGLKNETQIETAQSLAWELMN